MCARSTPLSGCQTCRSRGQEVVATGEGLVSACWVGGWTRIAFDSADVSRLGLIRCWLETSTTVACRWRWKPHFRRPTTLRSTPASPPDWPVSVRRWLRRCSDQLRTRSIAIRHPRMSTSFAVVRAILDVWILPMASLKFYFIAFIRTKNM